MTDSHCHLADAAFSSDLEAVVDRARNAAVTEALVILEGGNQQEAAQAAKLESLWPEVRVAIGVHPHMAHEFAEDPDRAAAVVREQSARTPSVRAIGEIGLDYHYDHSPREVQRNVFRSQMRLARELRLPVVIHTREADDDTIAILREEGDVERGGVLHCFTGTPELARNAIELGFYISLAGIITFPKAGELRETVKGLPVERLLSETDSPFLAPIPHRGKRNEPAYVTQVVETLATIQSVETSYMAGATHANFRRLFRP